MKFGFIGGGILLILTLVFSYIAIQNNKIAKEITVKSFKLDREPVVAVSNSNADTNVTDSNTTEAEKESNNKVNVVVKVEAQESNRWKEFDSKFEDFNKKFDDF